jgi:HK97 gp10 family phage protein
MANGFIETTLRGELDKALGKFEKDVRDKILFAGVAAIARVIYEEARMNVSGARAHPKVLTGALRESIFRAYSERASNDDIKSYRISWNIKIAPHGHLIEFGTSRSPAYPFMRPAFAKMGEAIRAGQNRMSEKMKELV